MVLKSSADVTPVKLYHGKNIESLHELLGTAAYCFWNYVVNKYMGIENRLLTLFGDAGIQYAERFDSYHPKKTQ